MLASVHQQPVLTVFLLCPVENTAPAVFLRRSSPVTLLLWVACRLRLIVSFRQACMKYSVDNC